jgi:hypothetical protein
MEETAPIPSRSALAVIATIWILSFGLLATLLYFYGLHSYWGNADLVRGLLQGGDMARGNVLLNHWYSGGDNFLTIDLLFFAVGVLVVGQKIVLLHLISCLIWAALIFASAYIAAFRLTRWAKCCAIAAVAMVLAFPCSLLAQALSESMAHVGTTLYVLLAFIALRTGRFGWGWIIAVVLLAASTFGDPLTVAYAIGPVLVVGILDSFRERDWRRGISTWSAPIAAVVSAGLFRLVTDLVGTFQLSSSAPFASHAQMLQNLRSLLPDAFSLLGFGPSFYNSGVPWELEVFRSFGLLILTVGVAAAIPSLLRGVLRGHRQINDVGTAEVNDARFRLSDLLLLAVLGDGITFVLLGLPGSGLHYLTPGITFASILGAMFLGRFVEHRASVRALQAATIVTLLIAGCCASSVAVILSDPVPTSPYSEVADFLALHHLYKGLGDYWTSAPITVYSGGKVAVRQVNPSPTGGLQPYLVLANSAWYEGRFQFLIYSLNESAYGAPQYYGQRISDTYEFPYSQVSHEYTYLSFHIVVWKRPLTIAELDNPQLNELVGMEDKALPGLSNWPKLSTEPANELPLFALAGQTSKSKGPTGNYEVNIYNFYSPTAETDFYENKDLALSYAIPNGAALSPLFGNTGVSGISEGFNVQECGSSSAVEPGMKCSDGTNKPHSTGVITMFERGSTITVITYRPNGQHIATSPSGELAYNVKIARSVISLLASAGIR